MVYFENGGLNKKANIVHFILFWIKCFWNNKESLINCKWKELICIETNRCQRQFLFVYLSLIINTQKMRWEKKSEKKYLFIYYECAQVNSECKINYLCVSGLGCWGSVCWGYGWQSPAAARSIKFLWSSSWYLRQWSNFFTFWFSNMAFIK